VAESDFVAIGTVCFCCSQTCVGVEQNPDFVVVLRRVLESSKILDFVVDSRALVVADEDVRKGDVFEGISFFAFSLFLIEMRLKSKSKPAIGLEEQGLACRGTVRELYWVALLSLCCGLARCVRNKAQRIHMEFSLFGP
jgi:hypothetical protein